LGPIDGLVRYPLGAVNVHFVAPVAPATDSRVVPLAA
jgi:hypothetical protein